MNNHTPNPSPKTRIVLTFDGSTLVSTQILTPNEHVLNLEDFKQLASKAGFAIVPQAVADYLNNAASALGVKHG